MSEIVPLKKKTGKRGWRNHWAQKGNGAKWCNKEFFAHDIWDWMLAKSLHQTYFYVLSVVCMQKSIFIFYYWYFNMSNIHLLEYTLIYCEVACCWPFDPICNWWKVVVQSAEVAEATILFFFQSPFVRLCIQFLPLYIYALCEKGMHYTTRWPNSIFALFLAAILSRPFANVDVTC